MKDVALILCLLFLSYSEQHSKYTCERNARGEEHCHATSKEPEDENEPCFYEEAQERLIQWDPVKVGYQRTLELEDGKFYTMTTMAFKPKLFVIPEFLTDEECAHIIAKAQSAGMERSGLHIDQYTKESKNYTYSRAKTSMQSLDLFDFDGNGKVSKQEIMTFAAKMLKTYINATDLEKMITDLGITAFDDDGFITPEEYESLNTGGLAEYFKDLRENHPRFRDRYSEQTWLRQGSAADSIMKRIRERVIRLTRLPRHIVEGGEPLQVLHYDPHGHYHAHFDGQEGKEYPGFKCCHLDLASQPVNCKLCRFITIVYYLNDVEEGGETAFPVADNPNYDHMEFRQRKEHDLYNLSKFCHNASIVVPPKKRTAVMWYNHHMDENGWLGEMDTWSLHGGCDVIRGEKWMANNWLTAPPSDSADQVSLYLQDEDLPGIH